MASTSSTPTLAAHPGIARIFKMEKDHGFGVNEKATLDTYMTDHSIEWYPLYRIFWFINDKRTNPYCTFFNHFAARGCSKVHGPRDVRGTHRCMVCSATSHGMHDWDEKTGTYVCDFIQQLEQEWNGLGEAASSVVDAWRTGAQVKAINRPLAPVAVKVASENVWGRSAPAAAAAPSGKSKGRPPAPAPAPALPAPPPPSSPELIEGLQAAVEELEGEEREVREPGLLEAPAMPVSPTYYHYPVPYMQVPYTAVMFPIPTAAFYEFASRYTTIPQRPNPSSYTMVMGICYHSP